MEDSLKVRSSGFQKKKECGLNSPWHISYMGSEMRDLDFNQEITKGSWF